MVVRRDAGFEDGQWRAEVYIVHSEYCLYNLFATLKQQNAQYFFLYIYLFFFLALRPNAGHGRLVLEVPRSHTATHHSR